MPGYISQWWDSVTSKYKEVSKEAPFPVTMIGGGAGGAEEVTITGVNGDAVPTAADNDSVAASTVALPTEALGYHWDSTDWNRNYGGGYAAHNSATTAQHVNARMLGVNGPNAVPIKADTEGNLITNTSGSTQMIANIQNVTTAGTRVQLPSHACREVTVIAKKGNTGQIFFGDSTVSSTVYGAEMDAKDSITQKVANSDQIWIDASVSGEGVSYIIL